MIVDDEPAMRHLLQKFFAAEGYSIDVAADLEEAYARIAVNPPSVVLLDLMLHCQSGLDFLRRRMDEPLLKAIPVIVLSAVMRHSATEVSALGASACIEKPFDLDTLSAIVRACVSQRRSA